ncbi:leucine zipper putative tumor suppressor 1 isoform X1 [Molossus molossus]|uniref:Leucine zipper tumor suppressor 1 n=1 Tax=Molossus molossus TaxID=27622 RepID=A0A7J8I9X1_MOLMO|nr:leucine zipper putative tumor suppressor 1 isoform X1 [Molossus molossus]KAF6480975.1 leucine zipper tumor suppressor 1 [Molossus molossus]
MGSVSSLISGHGFHSKHCRASQYKLRKSSHLKKLNRYSDGLLRFGFSQDSGHGKSSSKMGKSEDFFYIKVSQKARGSHHPDYTALSSGDLGGQAGVDFGPSTPPKLMPFSNPLEMASEKGAARPTAFKPVLPRSGAVLHTSPESAGHQLHAAPPDRPKEQELKPSLCSGALSDSGRNSMSSLPTHSTSSSYQLDPLVTAMGPASRFGGSAHNITQGILLQDSNMMSLKALSFSDGGSKLAHPSKADRGSSCVRSPISTDECAIQELEQKLLEREGELQQLRRSFEGQEPAPSQAYEERPWRSQEEPEGPEPRSKLKAAPQKSQRTQQVLQLQVLQLQQEKRQLRQELESLMKEQDLLETKLRSYEKEKTSFAPALEETQWEVCQKSGEISLLKQQLKESQMEVNAKASEILSLRAQLKDTRGKLEGMELKTRDLESALRTKGLELEVCENELQRKKNESELLREKVSLLEQELQELRAQATLQRDCVSRGLGLGPAPGAAFSADSPALQRELERLRAELKEQRQGHDQMSSGFQHERLVWKEEKEKVIQYQKQLQQSYLAMYQRNQRLEKALQQLAHRDGAGEPLEIDLEGADIPYEDIIATEI